MSSYVLIIRVDKSKVSSITTDEILTQNALEALKR
jgi:hypothetical protein